MFGLALTTPTIYGNTFWQWLNQMYHSQLNIGNRNVSVEFTDRHDMVGKTAAFFTSLIAAFAIRMFISNLTRTFTGGLLMIAGDFATYLATGTAGFINAYMLREPEMY